MKIVIAGPGAIGSLFAAYLSKAKGEVYLLDKDAARAKKLNQSGISVKGVSGTWQEMVKVSCSPQKLGSCDLLIVCVKSYDTKALITYARPLIGANTSILTVQNGIGNAQVISELLRGRDVFVGATNQGANLLDPGQVHHAGSGETIIGSPDNKLTGQLRQIRQLFNNAGIPARLCKDIKGVLWSKLIVNVGINALTGITRLRNGQLLEAPGARSIMRQAVAEATRVAKRKRVKLQFDDSLTKVEAVCSATANNISSMLADILKKKRTEIDFINGVIVQQGEALRMPVSVNSLLVDLVKTIELNYHSVAQ